MTATMTSQDNQAAFNDYPWFLSVAFRVVPAANLNA